MSAPLIVVGIIAVGVWLYSRRKNDKSPPAANRYSNPNNNHDDQKYKHSSRGANDAALRFRFNKDAWKNHEIPSAAIRYSNPNNNHDDQKNKHSSSQSAEAEVRRMQRARYAGSERLNVYYNRERDGWFVGKSRDYF